MFLELSHNCIINYPPLIDPKVSSDRDFTRACMSMANDNVPTLLLRASGFLSRTRVSVRMQSSDALHGSRIIYDMQSIANLCHVRFFRARECLSLMAQIEREKESVCVVQVHRNRIELHLMYLIRMMLPLLACCWSINTSVGGATCILPHNAVHSARLDLPHDCVMNEWMNEMESDIPEACIMSSSWFRRYAVEHRKRMSLHTYLLGGR